jgi:hypothetical protein
MLGATRFGAWLLAIGAGLALLGAAGLAREVLALRRERSR